MSERRIGVVMHGVTGRMGANQHLVRSILAIRADGGVRLGDGTRLLPDPLLVGRDAGKLQALARAHAIGRWTTDLERALASRDDEIFFDAASTRLRPRILARAIAAGKHVYCEKPVATSTAEALRLVRAARRSRLKNGVVQDKRWLPGIVKLRRLRDEGFFGRILSVRAEFGYWVFEGDPARGQPPAQRPSWNYRRAEGGGIVLDMFAHWRYLLDDLFGGVRAVSCVAATHVPWRWDEAGRRYRATADDAAYATFLLPRGVIGQFNSAWTVRVRRDDLLVLQVDGTEGSAVAGLRRCFVQSARETPKPVWNPDAPQPLDFYAGWREVYAEESFPNAFRAQWELFLRHVAEGTPFPWDLADGARGVQLAELALRSWKSRRWIAVPALRT